MTGKEAKELRLKLKLSQRQLASKMGVTNSAVSRWESGEKPVARRVEIQLLGLKANKQ